MNVKGFDNDGAVIERRVAAQNVSLMSINNRYLQAVRKSPSEETENELVQILEETEKAEYAKGLRYQCYQVIAQSKMQRHQYQDAIPFLIKTLRVDEERTDVWVQVANCAQETKNINLYRAAVSRILRYRPQLQMAFQEPLMPTLATDNIQPTYLGYVLQSACWRLFLTSIVDAITKKPSSLIALHITSVQSTLQIQKEEENVQPPPSDLQYSVSTVNSQHPVSYLANITLTQFFDQIGMSQFESNKWVATDVTMTLLIHVLDQIATLEFHDKPCPRDISILLLDLVKNNSSILPTLANTTRLFLAELACVHRPEMCQILMEDVVNNMIHPPNALLRICYIQLEMAIRNNLDWKILDRLYQACVHHLPEDNPEGLCVAHAAIIIDKKLLEEKAQQVKILRMISEATSTVEDAVQLFAESSKLQFLSLANIVTLFNQFNDEATQIVFPQFLKLIPDLIRKNHYEVDRLEKVWPRIQNPMDDECVSSLIAIFTALKVLIDQTRQDTHAPVSPSNLLSIALAICRASTNYPNRPAELVKIHKILGKYFVCHEQNGKFLEYLLDALLEHPDEFENETTQAFTCYFSDYQISNNIHHSKLKFRCSRFIQPFINHIFKLEDKGSLTVGVLFTPYLGIWKHSKGECNCIQSIEGWRLYKVIKKKENLLARSELPPGFTPQKVLEDLLKHDQENSPESRAALAKVLIRKYISHPNEIAPLHEAMSLLEGRTDNPKVVLIRAIVIALANDPTLEIANSFLTISPLDSPKQEARRLYWGIRIFHEIGQDDTVKPLCQKVLTMNNVPSDFIIQLHTLAAEVLHDKDAMENIINKYCKSINKPPLPIMKLAAMEEPAQAYKTLSKIIRKTSNNINMFYNFTYHPPFLMERPNDLNEIHSSILRSFVDLAIESGNYIDTLILFNPSKKLDRKASRVLKTNREVFGMNRLDIFRRYIEELTKDVLNKPEKDAKTRERVDDALSRGSQIVDGDESLMTALDDLFQTAWKKYTGEDVSDESTPQKLVDLIRGVVNEDDDEEEDEEDDGDYIGEKEDGEEEEDEAEGEPADDGDDEVDDEVPEDDDEDDEAEEDEDEVDADEDDE